MRFALKDEIQKLLKKNVNNLLGILKVARDPKLRCWRFIVALSWFTFALALLLYLSGVITFEYHSNFGIHGWISVNKYPKHQEIFWFLMVTFGVPVFVLTGQFLWVITGAFLSLSEKSLMNLGYPLLSLCHLPLLMLWSDLISLRQDCIVTIFLALGISLFSIIIAVVSLKIWERKFFKKEVAEDIKKTEDDVEPAEKDLNKSHWFLWFRRIRITLRILVFFIILPLLVYFLASKPPRKGNMDLFHEGEFVIPMHEFIEGGVPYRDIYLQHGLIHNLGIPLLGAQLYGPTLTGVRLIKAQIDPLGYVGFYFLILSLVGCNPLPIIVFLIAICMDFIRFPHPGRSFFGTLSLGFIALSIRYGTGFDLLLNRLNHGKSERKFLYLFRDWIRGGWFFLFAGVFMFMALLYSVEVGLYSLFAGGTYLLISTIMRRKISILSRLLPIITYSIGIGIVISPFLIYLAINSAIVDFVNNLWVQCIYQIETWGLPFPGFFANFRPLITDETGIPFSEWIFKKYTSWYFLPIFLSIATSYLAFRSMGKGFWQSRTAPYLLLLSLSAAAFFRTPLGRSDSGHIHYGIIFSLILVIFIINSFLVAGWTDIIEKTSSLVKRLLGAAKIMVGFSIMIACIWWLGSANSKKQGFKYAWKRIKQIDSKTLFKIPKNLPESPSIMKELPRRQARTVKRLVQYIQDNTKKDEKVFDFTNHAGLLLFADRRPVSRYFQIAYATTPSLQEEVIADLEREKPPIVLYYYGGAPDHFDGIPNPQRHPIIDVYLKKNYKPAKKIRKTWFWKLR